MCDQENQIRLLRLCPFEILARILAVALPQDRRDAYRLDLSDLPYHMSDGVLEQLDELSFHLPSLLEVFGVDKLSIKALSLRENDLHGKLRTWL